MISATICLADCLEMLQADPEVEMQRRIDEELDKEIERLYGYDNAIEDIGWFDLQ